LVPSYDEHRTADTHAPQRIGKLPRILLAERTGLPTPREALLCFIGNLMSLPPGLPPALPRPADRRGCGWWKHRDDRGAEHQEIIMPKLTDSQLVILSAASQRKDGALLPLPKSLKLNKGALTAVLNSLLKVLPGNGRLVGGGMVIRTGDIDCMAHQKGTHEVGKRDDSPTSA
jgi:hypothetical protein